MADKLKHCFKERRGTTLLEVILVIVLLGILTSITYPKMGGNRDHFLLDATARALAVNIREAQSHAVTVSQKTMIGFYCNLNLYYVELSGEKEWIFLPRGITISDNNFPKFHGLKRLSFTNTGAPNRGGHVGFQNERGDRLYVIVTPATGRVRIGSEAP